MRQAQRMALALPFNSTPRPPTQTAIDVRVDSHTAGVPLNHFWSACVGAGRANEGLRASWLEQLKLCVDQCGFRYLRFHGLFHDDMFVYRELQGKPVYNWQYVDDLLDRMLAIGIRPFVELTFFPSDIAGDNDGFAWWKGHGTPPKDFTRWSEVVGNFVRHCSARYGETEVRSWFFEIWNEPNLRGFWNGTQQQFFEMYRVIAHTLKSIDPQLRIGGPATSSFHPDEAVYQRLKNKKDISAADFIGVESKGPWIEDFLAFCEKENLPVDFVSCHPYPTSYPIDSTGNSLEISRPVSSTREDILWLRKAMAKTRYANAEIHLTEWSSSPSIGDYTHDYLQAATYIVKVNLDCIGLAQSLSYWTFTDIFEEGGGLPSIFCGEFGLVNFQGIVKPSFHAYRMLHRLGNRELHREEGCVVTCDSADGRVAALLYHYPQEVLAAVPISKGSRTVAERTLSTGSQREAKLRITGLQPGTAFTIETLDSNHGFALRDWQAMGSPEPPTREQTTLLRAKAMATDKRTLPIDAEGVFAWQGQLDPWSVIAVYQEK
jgi:xylan 1,4-beta-xylosidase